MYPSEIYVNRACTLRGRATVLPYYVAPKSIIKHIFGKVKYNRTNIPIMKKVFTERFRGKYPARKTVATEFAHKGGENGLQVQIYAAEVSIYN